MAKFLTTSKAITEIENIINTSKRNIYLVTPYLDIPSNLLQTLNYQSIKGKHICIIYGKDKLIKSKDTFVALKECKNIEIRFLSNLHAKCYFNEINMVITSLNLYDFSQNNKEMGVLLNCYQDNEAFQLAKNEFEIIYGASVAANFNKDNASVENRDFTIPEGIYKKNDFKKPNHVFTRNIKMPFNNNVAVTDIKTDNNLDKRPCKDCGKLIPSEKYKPRCEDCFKRFMNKNKPYYK